MLKQHYIGYNTDMSGSNPVTQRRISVAIGSVELGASCTVEEVAKIGGTNLDMTKRFMRGNGCTEQEGNTNTFIRISEVGKPCLDIECTYTDSCILYLIWMNKANWRHIPDDMKELPMHLYWPPESH